MPRRRLFTESMKPLKPLRERFNANGMCPIQSQYQKKYPCTGAPYLSTDNDIKYFYLLDAYGK